MSSALDHEDRRRREQDSCEDLLLRRFADGLGLAKMPPPAEAAVAAIDMAPSPALQIIGKMRETLQGRCIGILTHDGTDAAALKKIQDAAEKAGASVKIVAPKIGGARLSDGWTRRVGHRGGP